MSRPVGCDPGRPARSFRLRIVAAALRALPVRHGRHRLLDRIAPWLESHFPHRCRLIEQGRQIEIDASDLVGRHFLMLGTFDPEVVDVLGRFATRGDLLWDIGANQGFCAYQLLRRHDDLRVVAIEPQARLAELIRSNLEELCPGRYEVHACAISDAPGEADLHIDDANLGGASLVSPTAGGGRVERVRLHTASDVLKASSFGPPTLVKIDVEGHEAAVLASLEPLLEDRPPRVIVFEHLGPRSRLRAGIADRLGRHGYRLHAVVKSPWRTCLRDLDDPAASAATDFAAVLAVPAP